MKRFFNILYDTDQHILNYVWKAALISLVPSIILGLILWLCSLFIPIPDNDLNFEGSIFYIFFSVVLFSPWVETLMMLPILWILKRLIRNNIAVAFSSAAIWAVLHSTIAIAWGFIIWWAFFVFSICFLEWEKKSKKQAIVATASVHMCQNFIPLLAVLFVK